MKLIIDIPEKNYEIIKSMAKEYRADTIEDYIANGIPLEDIKAEIQAYKNSVDKAISEDEFKREGMKLAYQDSIDIINKHIGEETE